MARYTVTYDWKRSSFHVASDRVPEIIVGDTLNLTFQIYDYGTLITDFTDWDIRFSIGLRGQEPVVEANSGEVVTSPSGTVTVTVNQPAIDTANVNYIAEVKLILSAEGGPGADRVYHIGHQAIRALDPVLA